MSDDEFISVPVCLGFDSTKPIGELRILKSALPPTPDFVFSLGYSVLETNALPKEELDLEAYVKRYELGQVALLSDANYIGYLRQVGKLPPVTG